MIVQRTIHRAKPGHVGDFLELGKSTPNSPLSLATKRTYTASVGVEATTVCHELEFEDLAELDQTWAAWWADPRTPAFMEKYWALVEGGHNEVWNMEE